jgi:crotonobetainyl-CoA:carnitine CoA-transferase CaiB-like acyl-CoA transferase
MRFSRTPARRDKAAPMLGENTRDVLSEIGYAGDAIVELLGRKVIAVSGDEVRKRMTP